MKRVFSFLMALTVLLSAFAWTGAAQAAGSLTYIGSKYVWGKGVVFVFEGSGLKNKDLKGATLFVGSNEYKLSCSVNKQAGKVVCVAGGGLTKYAGDIGFATLAGQSFAVTIPGRTLPETKNTSLSCPEGTVPGADVTFFTSEETTTMFFVTGSTSGAVRNSAENMLGEFLLSIEEIGKLYCGEEPK